MKLKRALQIVRFRAFMFKLLNTNWWYELLDLLFPIMVMVIGNDTAQGIECIVIIQRKRNGMWVTKDSKLGKEQP